MKAFWSVFPHPQMKMLALPRRHSTSVSSTQWQLVNSDNWQNDFPMTTVSSGARHWLLSRRAFLNFPHGLLGGGQVGPDLLEIVIWPDFPSSDSSSWVGAWWLPFVICGAAFLLVSIPLSWYLPTIPIPFSWYNNLIKILIQILISILTGIQKAGDAGDISPPIFWDFPPNLRLSTVFRRQHCQLSPNHVHYLL